MPSDLYQLLGLQRNADAAAIRTSWRRIAARLHPDSSKDPKAAENYKAAKDAFTILSNPAKRAQYDNGGGVGAGGGFAVGFPTAFDEDEVLEKGDDFQIDLEIDFFESVNGCLKPVEYQREQVCVRCDGQGFYGQTDCRECETSGKKDTTFNVDVEIPPGVCAGQKLRVPGAGEQGRGGAAAAGDLIVVIAIKKDQNFSRVGNDVHSDLSIPFYTALFGGKARVKTIRGQVLIGIPPNTNAGSLLRIDNHGVRAGDKQGHHMAKIVLQLPKELSPRQVELMRAFVDEEKRLGRI
ncbi:DnaJ C-terminal domain-containing protein [Sphingopyxis sp.]|uniref:DnaJ C-terminal domain-containing protein n=1 Tax=Sphingopyxis sp. TaxID=1908224 RepID=UPI0025E1CC28|nr:DnaJ C-terminal domain-containing protein [Sphingopyxis sp.]MBK6414156.1 DnaJ domain-containing protein [Sphingopyxis sp.]